MSDNGTEEDNVEKYEKVEAMATFFDFLKQEDQEMFIGFIFNRLIQMVGVGEAEKFFRMCVDLHQAYHAHDCDLDKATEEVERKGLRLKNEDDWEDIIH
jgi:hypothetical protein